MESTRLGLAGVSDNNTGESVFQNSDKFF